MRPKTLTVVKTQDAETQHGGIGGETYRVPATYKATSATGRVYCIEGTPYRRMERPRWDFTIGGKSRGSYRTLDACLQDIAKMDPANAAQQV